jgi:16S rRNA (cytosine967-C5)-methyltransferase
MDARFQAASMLLDLHVRGGTAKGRWQEPRTGAETALVLGTLRRRGTLDAILAAHSTRRLPLVKPAALAVLRTALFELLFQDGAPPHAVVDAAVENVKSLGRPEDAAFVNALLRAILRGSRRVAPEEARDLRRALPREGAWILFARSVFPDRNHDPAGFLAARASVPPWIARRRLAELGFERALECLDLQARTPDTHLRVRSGLEEAARAALSRAGVPFRDGPREGMLTLPPHVRAAAVLEVCGPIVFVQDAVASQVAPFLLAKDPAGGGRGPVPAPFTKVLDWCAAPGGKTTHLADLLGDSGKVVACDLTEERLVLVRENVERLGLRNVELRAHPADLPRDFDAVLVDAPCSNTGVLARRPEARWRVRERHLFGLAQRQLRILADAAAHARPGGVVVYATCSLEPEENAGVVERFLARGGFALEEARTVRPDEAAGDGGFMARMRRV